MPPFVVGSQKEKARGNTTTLEQNLAQATSVVIPLLELGTLGYVTWVVCYLICAQYLINPSAELRKSFNVQPRRASAIAVIVIYAILLLLVLLPWMRLLQVIWSKSDIIPVGDTTLEKKDVSCNNIEQYDAYISDYEGYPLYCEKCHIYKPDRAHHCKELGRCVRKMDHYCPWAGGLIAQNSHKFFMQFVFYVAIYTTFVWIVVAIFLADRSSKTGSRPGTWIGALALGVLFCIFGTTMSCMTGQNLNINYTSVEAIQRGGISNVAFRITSMDLSPTKPSTPPTPNSEAKDTQRSDDEDDWPILRIVNRSEGRSFVVMQTKPLQHPWSTDRLRDWQETMGSGPLEWFLPLKMSPSRAKSREGEFRWGHVVYDMAEQYERKNPGVRLALLEGRRRGNTS